ncbi:MAG: PVC-type heme-binding CxxCH protein, partial [Verrucomicrobiota bacterium]
ENVSGIKPLGQDGQPLNLDFETGTLKDWSASGKAFERQPVRGDTVSKRRGDMKSDHQGDYWIGTFEIAGDDLQGILTSIPFKVTHPWASFLVAGGPHANTRVELVRADSKQVFLKVSGYESENLRPVIVDLQPHLGKEIFIRIVDEQGGHWGHVNFDQFVFHAAKPALANALDPLKLNAEAIPSADIVKFSGLSPEEAAAAVTVPPGFKVHLFAGEPNVQQPIAFCLDDRGRVWVAEGFTYPKRAPEGQGKDRILVLEDTDGDHRFDRRTVFMEKLNLVSGLEVGFGGVWIGAAPHLLFVPVSDWDNPKPAGEPKVLLDGWDYLRDTHETLNTFMWGPDGWLYGCHGVFCPSNVGKPGTPESERQWVDAAVWRYHPVKHTFEVFAEGTSNPWGIDFDEFGQCFIEACVVPHFWHMIQGARYERQGGEHYATSLDEIRRNEKLRDPRSRKPVYPYVYDHIKTHGDHVHWAGSRGPHAGNARSDAAGGGHAHAGVMIYLGESWPAEYRGQMFIGNIHGQRLNVDIPERRGSGYVGKHAPDFLNFNDKWSQTLNQLYDQDGSVYIIDWYDKNQCHHNNVDGHDRSNGRIFKVVYGQTKPARVDLQKLSVEELVKLVPSKNEWMSRHARRILQERFHAGASGAKSNAEALSALTQLVESSESTAARLRALWALHLCGVIREPQLLRWLEDKDEYLRAWSIQCLAEERNLSSDALQKLARMARADRSPFVRLYIASALQRTPVEKRFEILSGLLARGEDAADHNLPLMYWFATEPVVAADSAKGAQLLASCKIPRVREFIARRMTSASKALAAN